VVTICTTSLTFNNSTFCPHSINMCFVWISEQTAIISLNNINWLIFITETVFTARYGLGYIIQVLAVGWGFVPVLPIFPLSINAPHSSSLHFGLTRRTNSRSLGTFQKAMLFRKSESNGQKSTVTSSLKCFRDLGTLMCSNWAARELEKCGERK
jgi:hypothetical protein